MQRTPAVGVIATVATLVLASVAHGQTKVLEERFGSAIVSCREDASRGHLICLVITARAPYFGIQFGSENDPEYIGFAAGHQADSGVELLVDTVFEAGEAKAILTKLRNGKRLRLRYRSWESGRTEYGEYDLADFQRALARLDAFRAARGKP